jgi:hypothetical protein
MWSIMVNHMDGFLSLKEAALFSGRSESTLKRLIARVLDEHRHNQSLIDQIIRKRQAAKGYFWFISKEFLIKEFGLGEPGGDRDRSSERSKTQTGEPVDDRAAGHRTLESEIIAILKEQLRVKDEQIRNFQERDKEYNILLKTFQDKLFLLEGGRTQENPEVRQEQTPEGGREEEAVGDPFAAAAPWPEEEGVADSEQETSAADGWAEEEMPVPDEELAATMESTAAQEQPVGAESSGGEGETEGAAEAVAVADTPSVQQQEATVVPDAGVSGQAGREEEPPVPVAAAQASDGQGAGEGSATPLPPEKKKGFWRRVFGG